MIKSDKKLGRKIRSAKRMMELLNDGAVILYCPYQYFAIDLFEVDVTEFVFEDVKEGIKKGNYYEEEK